MGARFDWAYQVAHKIGTSAFRDEELAQLVRLKFFELSRRPVDRFINERPLLAVIVRRAIQREAGRDSWRRRYPTLSPVSIEDLGNGYEPPAANGHLSPVDARDELAAGVRNLKRLNVLGAGPAAPERKKRAEATLCVARAQGWAKAEFRRQYPFRVKLRRSPL